MSPRPRGAAPGRSTTRWIALAVVLAGLFASLAVSSLLEPPDDPLRLATAAGAEQPASPRPVVEVVGDRMISAPGEAGDVGIALVDPGGDERAHAAALADTRRALERHGMHATWFVTGRDVLDDPGTVGDVFAAGDEVGITGFSGQGLVGVSPWRQRIELATSQGALASRAGVTTPLLLLPSASATGTVDPATAPTARLATREGYALVLGRPPEQVTGGAVAVLPVDRHAAARLDALAARLARDGLRATTVSAVAGLDPRAVNPPATVPARGTGWALTAAVQAAGWVVRVVRSLFYPIALLMVARALVAVVLATRHARRLMPEHAWIGPVTVIVPAYNEAAGIEASLRSLVDSYWPYGLEVIVVDDGSTDATAAIVRSLGLHGVTLIRQPNQGKPAALNTGIAAATTDVVVMVDGDTVFEPGTVAELVAPFADPRVGATSGNAKVINRGSLLGRWQHIEYVMGFNLDRRLLAGLHAIATVPGAAGAFRTAALHQVGGVSQDTLAEDTDLTIAVQRAGWQVIYQDEAVAWTEAPSTVGDLWRQRYRWSYGTLQSVWKHRRGVIERRPIGWIGLPYAFTFQFLAALLGPVVDVAALYGLLSGDLRGVAVVWLGFTAAQVVLATWAFRLDGESLRPLWAVPLQQFAYRQLMYLVVIQSVVAAGAGTRLRWHKLRRLGLSGNPAVAGAPVSRQGRYVRDR